jgi:hypothetical protein
LFIVSPSLSRPLSKPPERLRLFVVPAFGNNLPKLGVLVSVERHSISAKAVDPLLSEIVQWLKSAKVWVRAGFSHRPKLIGGVERERPTQKTLIFHPAHLVPMARDVFFGGHRGGLGRFQFVNLALKVGDLICLLGHHIVSASDGALRR